MANTRAFRSARLLLALPILLVVLCACSVAAPPDGSLTPVSPVPQASAEPSPYPLDAFDATEEERQLLQDAEVALVAECMARQGFADYPAPPTFPVEHTATPTAHFGVTDAAVAAEFGYHDPVPPELDEPAPQHEVREMTDAEHEAYYGFPPGMGVPTSPPTSGCAGEAALDLYGDTRTLNSMASRLAREVSGESLIDPRVMSAIGAWAECMSRHGFDVVLPQQPVDDARVAPDAPLGPSAEQIEMAMTDVACKSETDLVPIWTAVEIEMQNNALADDYNRAFLADERARIDAMLERAVELTPPR